MELTIHSVERMQGRTGLSISEFRTIFNEDAYVEVSSSNDAKYLLFFDYVRYKYVVAVVKNHHLITVMNITTKLSRAMQDILGPDGGVAAKRKVRELTFSKILGDESDFADVVIVIEDRSSSEQLARIEAGRTKAEKILDLSKEDVLDTYVDVIEEMILNIPTSVRSGKRIRCFVYYKGFLGKLLKQYKISARLIALKLRDKNRSIVCGKAIVNKGDEEFIADLGELPENAIVQNTYDFISTFRDTLHSMHAAIQNAYNDATAHITYDLVLESDWLETVIFKQRCRQDTVRKILSTL